MFYSLSNHLGRGLSGFTPLRYAPALWLDAADASTLYNGASLAAADEPISSWRDKSGNDRHATQATGVSQPLRKAAVQNSNDVVRFDGVNDYLNHPLAINGGNHTTFIVAKGGSTNWETVFGSSDAGAAASGMIFASSVGVNAWGTYTNTYVSSGVSASSFVLMQSEYNGSSTTLRTNGASVVVGGAAYSGDSSERKCIGASYTGVPTQCLNGDIAEILVFPTALSDTERENVELYLNRKWGIY
jgi:hypothetical protein